MCYFVSQCVLVCLTRLSAPLFRSLSISCEFRARSVSPSNIREAINGASLKKGGKKRTLSLAFPASWIAEETKSFECKYLTRLNLWVDWLCLQFFLLLYIVWQTNPWKKSYSEYSTTTDYSVKALKEMTRHLWHLVKYLLKYVEYTKRLLFVSRVVLPLVVSMFYTIWGSQQDVLPLAHLSVQRQGDKTCMFALQRLCVFLPYSITQSYRTAITRRHPDLGWIGKYSQFPLDHSLSKHTK